MKVQHAQICVGERLFEKERARWIDRAVKSMFSLCVAYETGSS